MDYALFLGTGAVGQLELFTAMLLKDPNRSPDEIYSRVKEISNAKLSSGDKSPFWGYHRDTDDTFQTFHPPELYHNFETIVRGINDSNGIDQIVGAEECFERLQSFRRTAKEEGLDNVKGMYRRLHVHDKDAEHCRTLLSGGFKMEDLLDECGYAQKDISEDVKEMGYPMLIAGGHFIATDHNQNTQDYNDSIITKNIPHEKLVSIMGSKTQVAFIEEGDLIREEGVRYIQGLMPGSIKNEIVQDILIEAKEELEESSDPLGIGLRYFNPLAEYIMKQASGGREYSVQTITDNKSLSAVGRPKEEQILLYITPKTS